MTDAVSEQYQEALRRGHVAVVKGRPREAVQHYEEAGRLAPDRPVPFVSMGSVYLQMRRPREAIAAYDEALRRAPTDLDALRGKAKALEAEGQTSEASALARHAGELQAEQEAAQQSERARSAAAQGMEQHFVSAMVANEGGDPTLAVQEFVAAAHGYLVKGVHGAAFDAMMRALEVHPGALSVHLLMAEAYLRGGWLDHGVERLLLIESRLRVDHDAGARNVLSEVAARYRGLDPRIERLATPSA